MSGQQEVQLQASETGRASMDDAEKLRRYERAYVAYTLGVPADVLDRFPYRIVHAHGLGGSMPVWSVIWTQGLPRGVEAQRDANATWTDIPSLFHDGEPDA